MFENETQEEYLARWAVYKNFLDFWNSIPITWHDDHDEGVSLTPFYISYPPSYAFQILKHMG